MKTINYKGIEFKQIKDFPNYYISNCGKIYSVPREKVKGGLLSQRLNNKGYVQVTLYSKGKQYDFKLHRLVASKYVPCPIDKNEVNHIDGDKTNNNFLNLQWCTRSENMIHAFDNKLIVRPKGKESHLYNKPSNAIKKVAQYNLNGELIKIWDSLTLASKYFGVSVSSISDCCRGKSKTCQGFNFRRKQ